MIRKAPRIIQRAVIEALEKRQLLSTVTLTPADNIMQAVNAGSPGDIFLLEAGTYVQGVDIKASGTLAAPIRIQAKTPGTVIINANGGGTGVRGSGQYIQLIGVTIKNQKGWGTYQTDSAALQVGKGWWVQDVVVENNDGTGVGVIGDDVTLVRVTAQDNGRNGIGGWRCSNIYVKDCISRRNNNLRFPASWEGGGGKWYITKNVVIDGMVSYNNYGPGIWFDYQNFDYYVLNSELYGNMGSHAGWEGVGVAAEINNGKGYIEGSYIHDNQGAGVALWEVENVVIQNNTIVNDSIDFRNMSGRDPYHIRNITILNNKFKNGVISANWPAFPIVNNNAGITQGIISDYNSFDNPAGYNLYRWNNVSYNDIPSVQSKLSFETHGAITTIPIPDPKDVGPDPGRVVAPAAPGSLSLTVLGERHVRLIWSDLSINEDGFAVVRSTDGTRFGEIGRVGKNITAFEDTGAQPGTVYWYKVQAFNIGGTSAFSNTGTAKTPGAVILSNYLGDRPWASATNGWGPVERNMSLGDIEAGDGTTLTLNGKTYEKGLGVHADSTIIYDLGGFYSRFLTDIGVDDAVGAKGSVIFQVFADNTKIYDSGIMGGNSATRSLNLNVTGKKQLKLVVLKGFDNTDYDHADWANARIVPLT